MARTRGTWTKGQGGKPKGAKDEVPRSFKASVREVFRQIHSEKPTLLRDAIIKGLTSRRPKDAFAYVRMLAELEGELKQQVEVGGTVNVDHGLVLEVRAELSRLAARAASGSLSPLALAEQGTPETDPA